MWTNVENWDNSFAPCVTWFYEVAGPLGKNYWSIYMLIVTPCHQSHNIVNALSVILAVSLPPVLTVPVPPIRDKLPWEVGCEKMLNTLCKHSYVDRGSTALVADFHVPVVDVYPHLAEEYLRIVR